jgi:hypothetical protein
MQKMNEKIEDVDNKSKVDLIKEGTIQVKNNIWKWIVIAIGFGGIGSLISYFIK